MSSQVEQRGGIAEVVQACRSVPIRLYRKYRAGRVFLTAVRKLVRKEREWQVPMRLRSPRWWRHGFLSRSAVLYDLDRTDPQLYLSDVHRYFRTKRMVHAKIQDVINNKLTTHLLLRSLGIPSAELVGVAWRDQVHRFPAEGRVSTAEHLDQIAEGDVLFHKVMAGAEGKNIHAVRRIGPSAWNINGTVHTRDSAVRTLSTRNRPMIVERGITQHHKQSELHPGSVNTVRVLTMPDVTGGGDAFIAAAVQRIGCRRSEPADNWTLGGLSSPIDMETGTLGRATRLPDGNVKEWFDHHPDTGADITGRIVPFWSETKELVLHAANVLSFLEYVGWDIVITEDGPVVLEANINTGVNVLQSHQPLLADPRVRAYYNERGIRVGGDQEPLPPDEAPL
ncbi:MAG TPA: hypothetical protein IAA98_13885 [Candidatus Avipropionibacterium avicola]|uniref:Alpha-L-glutamate ligase-related protein ATP-grasp domain-containing protein n=1 Tax=Candidatus Avipropionibacterium avicola TaxID=2840701 RepID=A0A9D1KPR2_9ACTN|nr:hypothetical protein [Candidatus Avipropionibacterium avicola]